MTNENELVMDKKVLRHRMLMMLIYSAEKLGYKRPPSNMQYNELIDEAFVKIEQCGERIHILGWQCELKHGHDGLHENAKGDAKVEVLQWQTTWKP